MTLNTISYEIRLSILFQVNRLKVYIYINWLNYLMGLINADITDDKVVARLLCPLWRGYQNCRMITLAGCGDRGYQICGEITCGELGYSQPSGTPI